MEGTFRSVDPLAYSVDKSYDLNEDVVKAFVQNDQAVIKYLCAGDTVHYDIFICVNKGQHAFILCVPVGNPATEVEARLTDPNLLFPTGNPFDVPDVLLCHTFELCFAHVDQRMYKIKYLIRMHKEIKDKIAKSYYIARYAGLNGKALQFTALRASPKRYRVILDDCVEFSKCFCVEALAYSNNYKKIEELFTRTLKMRPLPD